MKNVSFCAKMPVSILRLLIPVLISGMVLQAAGQSLASWTDTDIGAVGAKGAGVFNGGVLTMQGCGADIWSKADAFNFMYVPIDGDCQITARVTSLDNTDPWAKAGVMIRETLTAGSTHATMAVTPGNGSAFQRRRASGGISFNTAWMDGACAPYWVKLVRKNGVFYGFTSSDGATWSLIYSQAITMGPAAYAGLAVCSHTTSSVCGAAFDQVAVTNRFAPITDDTARWNALREASPGDNLTLSVGAISDTPVISYQWQLNGTNIASATNAQLQIPSFSPADAGFYCVAMANANGAATNQIVTLTRNPGTEVFKDDFRGATNSAWTILNQDASYYSVGDNGLSLRASSGDLWSTNNDYLNLFCIDTPTSGDFRVTLGLGALTLAKANNPQVALVAYDDDDNYVRADFFAYTPSPAYGIEFIRELPDSDTDLYSDMAAPTGLFFLRIVKTGATYCQYWSYDGITYFPANGTLTYGNGLPKKLGFTAMGDPTTSSVALVSSFVVESLPTAPAVVTQPRSQNVALGAAARLSVLCSGSSPFAYQWLFNGSIMAEATNASLQITNAQFDTAGVYSVVVTNAYGSVTSLPAALNILAHPADGWSFDGTAGDGTWSSTNTSTTPGGRGYLGPFGSQTVTLSMSNLPPHNVVWLECDLYVVLTWDGNSTQNGPDIWSLSVENGPSLLRTTFSNSSSESQAYPGPYPTAAFAPQSGASEVNSLGYNRDCVYHLQYAFPHSTNTLAIDFAGSGLGGLSDEYWGLDNVSVSLVTNALAMVQWTQSGASVYEDAASVSLTLQRIGDTTTAFTVSYATADQTAVAGVDYQAASGTVSFLAGETSKTISVPILQRGTAPDRSFSISLTGATGGASLGAAISAQISILQLPEVEFARANYYVTEADGSISLPIDRSGDVMRTSTVHMTTQALTAVSGADYVDVDGSHGYSTNSTEIGVSVTLNDDDAINGTRAFQATLSSPVGARLGAKTNTVVYILDNDTPAGPGPALSLGARDALAQPDGKILVAGGFKYVNGTRMESIARLNPDGSLDADFNYGMSFNNWVESIALQPDGKILAAGDFTQAFGLTRKRIIRLQSSGGLDPGFSSTVAPDNSVYWVVLQPDKKILISGLFNNVNSQARSKIARLSSSGVLDTNFVPPAFTGSAMWSMAVMSNGSVVCGTDCSAVSGGTHPKLVRLNTDGTLDATFNPGGAGPNGTVNSIVALDSGKLLIGGSFTTYNGVARNRAARINSDGTLDTSFAPGSGADSTVCRRLAALTNGQVYISGGFQNYNGVSLRRVARLNPDGTADSNFAPPGGANGYVYAVAPLEDGRVFVAGDFTVFNGRNALRYAFLNADGSSQPGPVAWTQWPAAEGGNDHWYSLTTQAETWPAAETEATVWGGHLAAVGSAKEQNFLQTNFLRDINLLRPFWIGFNDAAKEGTFVWSSGEPALWLGWSAGEPNNQNGNEDYATINWHFSDILSTDASVIGAWNDVPPGGTTYSDRSDGPHFGIMETAYSPQTVTITTQPVGSTNMAGDSVVFDARAAGAPPLTWQWLVNQTPIPGATNQSLALNNVQLTNAGVYSVLVSNTFAFALSSNARLAVYAPPQIDSGSLAWNNGKLSFSISSGPGTILQIETATNITGAAWTPIGVFTNTTGVLPFSEINSNEFQRFYRIHQTAIIH
jgi:uncharacterized delta-60 repeat protein